MAVRYTDVDLMLLNRWDEVSALREAFDELLGRMNEVVEAALQRTATHLTEKGFEVHADAKAPSLSFWKRDWVNRKGDGIYGKVVGFVPDEYARQSFPHPAVFLITEDFAALRLGETVEQFGRAFRAALTDDQRAGWNFDVEMDVNPIGREYSDVSERERVRMVTEPDELARFLIARAEELMELVPAVDATLARMTRK